MAANKFDQAMRMMLALMQARYSAIKEENNILMNEMRAYIQNNRETVCEMNPNTTMLSFSPYTAIYLNAALRKVQISGVETFRKSDGGVVLSVPNIHADKIPELERQMEKLAKEFCADFSTFKSRAMENDTILTIPSGELSHYEMMLLAEEMTNTGAYYYIDAQNQTLSYLSSQKKDVARAIHSCSAELASQDSSYFARAEAQIYTLHEQISQLGDTLANGESIFLVSANRSSDDKVYGIKFTNGSYTEVYKDENGLIREGDAKHLNFDRPDDVALACLQTCKFNRPLLVSQDIFENQPTEKINSHIQARTLTAYSEFSRNDNDRLAVVFVRNAYRAGIKIDLHKKDISAMYEDIKTQCEAPENADNKKMQAIWDTVKTIPPEEVQLVLKNYRNQCSTLKTSVIDKAEVLPEKDLNKDAR